MAFLGESYTDIRHLPDRVEGGEGYRILGIMEDAVQELGKITEEGDLPNFLGNSLGKMANEVEGWWKERHGLAEKFEGYRSRVITGERDEEILCLWQRYKKNQTWRQWDSLLMIVGEREIRAVLSKRREDSFKVGYDEKGILWIYADINGNKSEKEYQKVGEFWVKKEDEECIVRRWPGLGKRGMDT